MAGREPVVVWCFNAGSSSLKVAAFSCLSTREEAIADYHADLGAIDLHSAFTAALTELRGRAVPEPHRIGHRVVHGGPARWMPVAINADVVRDLEAAAEFAPGHQHASLEIIALAEDALPGRPQIACFDTAFHHALPDVARVLPVRSRDELRRFGFHGLSCESIVAALGDALGHRAVIAHLGSGASLTAVLDGRSHDTTMGLTPLGGIPMSTRSGDLDPGVIVHLVRAEGLDADGIETRVGHEGGLRTWSGRSSDMRALLADRSRDARAAFAVDAWCYAVRKQIGAFAAALDGIDTLVFAGGIGEHEPEIRAEVSAALRHLGIEIDAAANARNETVISAPKSRVVVRVIASDENRIVARHTAAVVIA